MNGHSLDIILQTQTKKKDIFNFVINNSTGKYRSIALIRMGIAHFVHPQNSKLETFASVCAGAVKPTLGSLVYIISQLLSIGIVSSKINLLVWRF